MHERSRILLILFLLLIAGCTSGRQEEKRERPKNRKERIKRMEGKINVTPSAEALKRGRVVMSYSDCFTCHKESGKKLGPAFSDIAARYPLDSAYVHVLSQRIIYGTKGMWGDVMMPAHPKISYKDAEAIVLYILSLDRTDRQRVPD